VTCENVLIIFTICVNYRFGRKRMCIIFCLLYSLCCLSKLSSNFTSLLIGRVLGGISTSVLFSVFESWYIHQHTVRKSYPVSWLSLTFSKATFFNGVLAIVAGIVAEVGVEGFNLGPVAPFVMAVPWLIIAAVFITLTWEENYGEQDLNWIVSCREGLHTIINDRRILSLGMVQSIFESNMYIFVFLWTPVLEAGKPPLGITFSCFMVAIMIGSSLYSVLLTKNVSSQTILCYCLMVMAASFCVCVLSTSPNDGGDYVFATFSSFVILEISVGLYFPCIGRLKGETIPENLRANIMNWFRVPMNVITCTALVSMHHLNHDRANQIVFFYCVCSSILGLWTAKYYARSYKTRVVEDSLLQVA